MKAVKDYLLCDTEYSHKDTELDELHVTYGNGHDEILKGSQVARSPCTQTTSTRTSKFPETTYTAHKPRGIFSVSTLFKNSHHSFLHDRRSYRAVVKCCRLIYQGV